MRERRRRGIPASRVDKGVDAVGREHLERAAVRGPRERMRVDAKEERSVDSLPPAVLDDGLRDGGDVIVVEAPLEGVAAMARSGSVGK